MYHGTTYLRSLKHDGCPRVGFALSRVSPALRSSAPAPRSVDLSDCDRVRIRGLSVFVNGSRLARRNIALPRLGRFSRAATENKKTTRSEHFFLEDPRSKASTVLEIYVPSVCRKWCFQHRVGGVQLEESDMTCQGTCSSSRTSRAAGRDSVVAGGHHTATTAAGLKDTGSIATDLSPHAGKWRANGPGHDRAPDHGLSSSMAPKRFTTSVPC